MLSGSSAVIKYLLFIFNFIFVITGIAILVVGICIKIDYALYEGLLNSGYYSTPELCIAIGIIIFIVAFFGCCGSIKENYCMVLTFASLMILIFILEIATGIAGYTLRDKAEDVLRESMRQSMKDYKNENAPWDKFDWDSLQTNFLCCGVDGSKDWSIYAADLFNTSSPYPNSCCSQANQNNQTACSDVTVYSKGCLISLEKIIRDNAVTLGGAGIGIAVVQLAGVILSCMLAKGIKQGYETV